MNIADRRRRQWVPFSAYFPHTSTPCRLKDEFGRDGLLVWTLFLAACKRSPEQGTFTYSSEESGWVELGLADPEDRPAFTLDAFFRFTGQLKQTRQTRFGQLKNVTSTQWEHWQDAATRRLRAEQKSRSRAQSAGDIPEPLPPPDLDLDLDLDQDHPPGGADRAVEVSREGRNGHRTPVVPTDDSTTRELVAYFIDSSRSRGVDVPQRVSGHLAREVKTLLDEGQPPTTVARGLDRMLERRVVQPGLLAGFLVEASLPTRSSARTQRIRDAGARHAASRGGP